MIDLPRKSSVSFRVTGDPQPGGSKRAFVFTPKGGGKPRASVTDDNPDAKPWKAAVAAEAAAAMRGRKIFNQPVKVSMVFRLRRPKGHYGTGRNAATIKASAPAYPDKKPDVLKLARSTEDAMSGIVYVDDTTTIDLHVTKLYATSTNPVGVFIVVAPMYRQGGVKKWPEFITAKQPTSG